MSSAIWTWDLHDGVTGNRICELTTVTGRQVAFKRSFYSEVQGAISIDDEAAARVKAALLAGWARLRLYRRSFDPIARTYAATNTPVFYGWLYPLVETGEETGLMQIVARSPFARLMGFPLAVGHDFGIGAAPYNVARFWLAPGGTNPVPFLGLAQGTNSTAIAPLVGYTYPAGQDVGGSIVEITQRLGSAGFDFLERFATPGTDPANTLAFFDTPTLGIGADKPLAKFEYGPGTIVNLRSAQVITAPPINYVLAIGANGLTSLQQDAGSQATYGVWAIPAVSMPSVVNQAALDARAQALLRPSPVKTLQMVPDATAPRPIDDFYLGDTVHAYVNRGSMQLTTAARVNAFTVVQDDDGLEQTQIPDPTAPEEDAFLRASITVEA